MAGTSGYSGKPLPRKLGFEAGQRVAFIALPEELDWLAGTVEFAAEAHGSWDALPAGESSLDVVHGFATSAETLARVLPRLREAIRPDGMIWISWPKRASKRPTDLTEDTVRALALANGLVDVKVCAVDETWSGLKLVIPRVLRERAMGEGRRAGAGR